MPDDRESYRYVVLVSVDILLLISEEQCNRRSVDNLPLIYQASIGLARRPVQTQENVSLAGSAMQTLVSQT